MMKQLKNYNPMLLCDFYKLSHREQYPNKTQKVYSTWTCRGSRMDGVNKTVFFGLQKFIKEYLIDYFNDNFFNQPIEVIKEDYKRVVKHTLGQENPNTDHIVALHKLGYLPIKIQAFKEGTLVPVRVPCITIENTVPEFYWVTNFLETLMSSELWQSITSATIALEYRKIVEEYSEKTCDNKDHLDFQCHDFSMRGMSSVSSAINSGIGHLISFKGTDTIPAILAMEKYYNADIEKELVGSSIPATEHSVMCSYGKTDELELFRHLIEDVYPTGIFSVVSDTWDLWKVCTEYLSKLKHKIVNRNGKVVIRPDSGNPVKILCGDDSYPIGTPQYKGVIEILWEVFGGTINKKGYKVLDSHIGAIYGDSITLERCRLICDELERKGFASSNIVYGVGSFSYQYNTRDTFSQALKATYAEVDGEERLLFKDPITDDGTKRSQRGMVFVSNTMNGIIFADGFTPEKIQEIRGLNLLEPVFENGKLIRDESLSDIRKRVLFNLK